MAEVIKWTQSADVIIMRKSSVKIVFVGDARVGKSSIIRNSLNGEDAEERNPNGEETVLNPISLSDNLQFQSRNLILIDTSSRAERMQATMNEIRNSDAVILVYDMDNEGSQTSLSRIWLPLIAQTSPSVPVILIGNKLDLVIYDDEKYVRSKVRRVISNLFKSFKVNSPANRIRIGVFSERQRERKGSSPRGLQRVHLLFGGSNQQGNQTVAAEFQQSIGADIPTD